MTNTTQWFAFQAYNSQTTYGYGTADEADKYAAHLNANREINVYAAHPVTTEEAVDLRLEDNTEAFVIADALDAIED